MPDDTKDDNLTGVLAGVWSRDEGTVEISIHNGKGERASVLTTVEEARKLEPLCANERDVGRLRKACEDSEAGRGRLARPRFAVALSYYKDDRRYLKLHVCRAEDADSAIGKAIGHVHEEGKPALTVVNYTATLLSKPRHLKEDEEKEKEDEAPQEPSEPAKDHK